MSEELDGPVFWSEVNFAKLKLILAAMEATTAALLEGAHEESDEVLMDALDSIRKAMRAAGA